MRGPVRVAWLVVFVGVLVAVALSAAGTGRPSGSRHPRWVITDLGTLGGKASWAFALNERGHVVGVSLDASGRERAFLWRGGKMISVGLGVAVDINESDQVIGSAEMQSDGWRSFVWQNGVVTMIPDGYLADINDLGQAVGSTNNWEPFVWQNGKTTMLPTLHGSGAAYAINEHGQVVGYSESTDGSYHAILWQGNALTDLGGPQAKEATAINDNGQIVGRGNDTMNGAFLWKDGKLTDLGTLGGPSGNDLWRAKTYAEAFGWFGAVFNWMPRTINQRGQIVGESDTTHGVEHAVLWENWHMRDLGTLPGRNGSEAVAINDRSQVVANNFYDNEYPRTLLASVWQNGKLIQLGTLGGKQSAAIAINNHGQIVGWSTTKSGQKHAVLWTLRPGA
jgi:probable HAF family extracellular repeat protein